MGNRYQDRHQYFDELVETSTAFYVNYIRQYIPVADGTRVLEVGCGEGGNLLPFALIGCEVTGVDFSEKKIENARNYFRMNGTEGSFFCANFFDLPKQDKPFDVILVHDVIEHIAPEDKGSFLERIHTFLAPKGVAFLAFPAWQMPFGGHQQTCVRKGVRVLPWIHLLPMPVYRGILCLFKESEQHIEELMDIRRSRMTVETFESLCRMAGYVVLERTLWLVNPHYKAKFGLRPMRLRLGLDRIPYLRNWLSTSCWYVIH
jgi:2-polyprenyl-3-methyl-5-hydroxy-6-metoxy-1,4-benzoquinol methylase